MSRKSFKVKTNYLSKFRPILLAINTPNYLLAKFLNPILSSITINEFTVKNSFDFAEEVPNYDHNLYMASLDVERYLRTSLWKKLLRTVSTTYSVTIFIIVN